MIRMPRIDAAPAMSRARTSGTSDPATPIKIAMLTASVSASSGGVAEALRQLSRTMTRTSHLTVEVFTLEQDGTVDPQAWAGVPVHLLPVAGPRSFGYAPRLAAALHSFDPQLVHVHGLWMYPSVAARQWRARTGRPHMVSPHGMLDPWALANSHWKKQIARALYEDSHLRTASCLHALCLPEAEAMRGLGLAPPICVIPNGVEPPPPPREVPAWRRQLPANARVLLFLGRVTPKKGVTALVRAWAEARRDREASAAWHLVVIGPAEAPYLDRLEAAAAECGVADTVHFPGPLYGPDKAASYAAADAFILPSLSEGLPIAPLEAWAQGLPALLTPHCNLPAGFDRDAALRIAPDETAIAAGIRRLMAMPDDARRAMGERGRNLVRDHFEWDAVVRELEAVYRWLLGREGLSPSLSMF